MEKENFMEKIVIVANGKFPDSEGALVFLEKADRIICCDGAVDSLVKYGMEPEAIVGDMDSISEEHKSRFLSILHQDSSEEYNDLTKAVRYCSEKGYNNLLILGATGLREDHALGNISLLAEYCDTIAVKMVTDMGIFIPVKSEERISAYPGQQISIFSFKDNCEVSSTNLKYHLDKLVLKNLWKGTLNECTSDYFTLRFNATSLIVFLVF